MAVRLKTRAMARYYFYMGLFVFMMSGLIACGGTAAILGPVDPDFAEPALEQRRETSEAVAVVDKALETSSATPSVELSATSEPVTEPTASLTATAQTPTATATYTSSPTPTETSTSRPTSTPTPLPTTTPIPTDTPIPRPTATFTPQPQPSPTHDGFTLTVPILMYHYLSQPPVGANAIRRDLSVSPADFETHLAYLRQSGYETIALNDLAYALSQEAPLPEKPIVITFDDGYRDNYENAFPLLRKYSYKATFFIFTQPIDTYNVDYLTWEMVTEMHQAGMEFGSHSYRHPDLRNRDVDFLVYEILGSKEAIEERIREPVRFFAYPSGLYDGLTIEVLDSANFWGAVTTQWGANQSFGQRFEMPRVRIRGNDRAEDLAYKLESLLE